MTKMSEADVNLLRIKLSAPGQLQNLLNGEALNSQHWLFSDLSLGAWQSFTVARDYFKQCDIPFPDIDSNRATSSDIKANFCYGEIIGKGIDSEAKGNISLGFASKLAKQLARYLPKFEGSVGFCCVTPQLNNIWRFEDRAFLQYLSWHIKGTQHRILFVDVTDNDGSGDSQFSLIDESFLITETDSVSVESSEPLSSEINQSLLIPGILYPEFQLPLGQSSEYLPVVQISKNTLLIDPVIRQSVSNVSRYDFDALANVFKDTPWLATYARLQGNNHFVKPMECAAVAWQHYAQGATPLALQIMEHVLPCIRDATQKAVLLCQLQGMRISLQLFETVANQPIPEGKLPQALLDFLWHARGWGMVFSGRPAEAKSWFDEAAKNFNQQNLIEYLYFLNIAALTEARLGNADKALAIELDIANQHNALPITDYMLAYVNNLNTARLYRWKKDFHTAEQYYLKAFATTDGCRSETDLYYVHASMALLAETTNDFDLALSRWIRSALLWLGCECPEAMGTRAIKVLFNGSEELLPEEVVKELSKALLQKLNDALTKSSLELPEWQQALLDDVKAGACEALDTPLVLNMGNTKSPSAEKPLLKDLRLGQLGTNFLWESKHKVKFDAPDSLKNNQHARGLAIWLGALFEMMNSKQQTPLSIQELAIPGTLVIAQYDDIDMPQSKGSAALVASRSAIDGYLAEEQWIECTSSINDSMCIASIKTGAAVNIWDKRNHMVYFKRYLKPIELEAHQELVLAQLTGTMLSHFETEADVVMTWESKEISLLEQGLPSSLQGPELFKCLAQMEAMKLIAFREQ